MSVRPDLYKRYHDVSNIEFSPFELHQSFHYNAKLSRDRRDVVAALIGALMVDTQPELQAAWRAVIRRGSTATDLQELGRLPLSETEAMQLATGPWRDPVIRNRKKIEWQTWAQEKYRKLAVKRESRLEGRNDSAFFARDIRPSTLD
jgi:hypothetical protein